MVPLHQSLTTGLGSISSIRVRIQKPVVTYDMVSYYTKAACPDLFAALPNVFAGENLIIFTNYC
jgi:hypothetical protein